MKNRNNSGYRYKKFTIEQLIDLYDSNKIKLSLAFQRNLIHSVLNMQNFISCIFFEHSTGMLSLAATSNGDFKVNSYLTHYYNKGYDYISIDGNNRTASFSKFVKDEFPVRTEEGNEEVKYYSELSSDLQQEFLKTIVPVVVYINPTIEKCASVFIAHNSSTKISSQEARNAILCKLSTFIRKLEEKIRSKFTKYTFTDDNKQRKNDDSMLEVLCLQIDPHRITNKSRKDYVWNTEKDITFDKEYFLDTLELAHNLLSVAGLKKTQSKSLLRDFAIARGLLHTVYIDQVDFGTSHFLEYFLRERIELLESSKLYRVNRNEQVTYGALLGKPVDERYHYLRVKELENIITNYIQNKSKKIG